MKWHFHLTWSLKRFVFIFSFISRLHCSLVLFIADKIAIIVDVCTMNLKSNTYCNLWFRHTRQNLGSTRVNRESSVAAKLRQEKRAKLVYSPFGTPCSSCFAAQSLRSVDFIEESWAWEQQKVRWSFISWRFCFPLHYAWDNPAVARFCLLVYKRKKKSVASSKAPLIHVDPILKVNIKRNDVFRGRLEFVDPSAWRVVRAWGKKRRMSMRQYRSLLLHLLVLATETVIIVWIFIVLFKN